MKTKGVVEMTCPDSNNNPVTHILYKRKPHLA